MFHGHRPYIESHGRECCDKVPALKHVDETPCLDRGDERRKLTVGHGLIDDVFLYFCLRRAGAEYDGGEGNNARTDRADHVTLVFKVSR